MAHMTVAVSERAIQESFALLVEAIKWHKDGSGNFGPFVASYDIAGHLEGGTIDLRGDNTIQVSELDIKWDKLEFGLGLDIPEICVGGGCINLPWPLPDICLPKICIFDDNPDIEISVDLAPYVAQEISFTGSIVAKYYHAAGSSPSPLCKFLRDVLVDASVVEPFPAHNQWHILIDPQTVDIDLFDFSDIVGDLIENALVSKIKALIPGGWVRDLILAIIGGITDLIRFLLDIPDEIEEWLSDLFNTSFGLFDFLIELVLDFFGKCVPIYRIDDPLQILPAKATTQLLLSGASVTLVPVALPIEKLDVHVTDDELVVQANIGASL
jgi:hypothetical protein